MKEYGHVINYMYRYTEAREAALDVLKRDFEVTKQKHPEYGLTTYEIVEDPPYMFETEVGGEPFEVEMGNIGWYATVED